MRQPNQGPFSLPLGLAVLIVTGMVMLGCPPVQPPEPKKKPVPSEQVLWRQFWTAIGMGCVPEVPTADMAIAEEHKKLLIRHYPTGYRAEIANAQMAWLRGEHRHARRALKLAESHCAQEQSCVAMITLLQNAVVADQHSAFNRSVLGASIRQREPTLDVSFDDAGVKLVPEVPDFLQRVASMWHASQAVRFVRAGLLPLAMFMSNEQLEKFLKNHRERTLRGLKGEGAAMLAWSAWPWQPPPELPDDLALAAMLLRAEVLVAPNGGVDSLDVDVIGPPPDHALWHAEGLPSQLQRRPSKEHVGAARELLAAVMKHSHVGPAMQRRAQLISAYADIIEGRYQSAQDRLAALDHDPHDPLFLMSKAHSALALEDLDLAVKYFKQATLILEPADAYGRTIAILNTMDSYARRMFHLGGRYDEGVALNEAVTAEALRHGYPEMAMHHAAATVQMMQDLSLHQEVLRHANIANQAISQAEKQLKQYVDELGPEWGSMKQDVESMPSLRRMEVAVAEANSLAHLAGRWKMIEERLGRAAELATNDPAQTSIVKSVAPVFRSLRAQSSGDTDEAMAIMKEAGDQEGYASLLVERGSPEGLKMFEQLLDETEKQLATPVEASTVPQRYMALLFRHRQTSWLRERYLWACERLHTSGRSKQVLQLWRDNPFVKRLAQTQPWREHILVARVHAAAGELAEAAEQYDRAIALLRQRALQGRSRDRHKSVAGAQHDAYVGRAAVAVRQKGAAHQRTALDRVDELRWLLERREVSREPLKAVPTIDWRTLGGVFKLGITVITISYVGSPGKVQAWSLSEGSGIVMRTLAHTPGALSQTLGKELEDTTWNDVKPTGRLAALADLIARNVPRDKPVALVVPFDLRAANLHLLQVAGEPLALRNPLMYAPSLRTLQDVARRNKTVSGPRVLVGTPVTADHSRMSIGETIPVEDEMELRQLSADKLLWNDKATVVAVRAAMKRARRVHISSHGQVDRLKADRTGVKLHDGILSVTDARNMSLQPSLIVLSACDSGVPTNPWFSGVPALDSMMLAAGAAAVVSTPRRVKPEVAALWMRHFHAALDQKKSASEAARFAYIETSKVFAKGKNWGAFSLVGMGMRAF